VRIAVIGSGLGGLAAAIRLRALGHRVTVFEQRSVPGGRASTFAKDGFTFDAGPTILTAPHLIDELFAAGGERREELVELVRLDPAYNIRFPDESVFHYFTDAEALRAEVERFSPGDVAGYDAFSRAATRIFRAGMALIDTPFHSPLTMLRAAPALALLRADRSVADLAIRHFRDERLQRVFSFHPLLVGGNPFTTTSVYALIHRLEQEWGVWFARGGTGALVRALVTTFERIGGRMEYEACVTEILTDTRSRRATGVRLATGRSHAADAVVCNADVAQTHLSLLPKTVRRRWTDARVRHMRQSMSLFVLYFGTKGTYPGVAHHEILMGQSYRELLRDIFGGGPLSGDFSLYLHRPTATDSSLAPPGCDAFYALVPVSHLGADIDWQEAGPWLRDAIVDRLDATLLPELKGRITAESSVDPRYFRDTLGAYLGNGFSFQPTFRQSAWFRPHNRSEDVANLYFCGAGTHPGAGVPGVISSGKIVANLIGPSE